MNINDAEAFAGSLVGMLSEDSNPESQRRVLAQNREALEQLTRLGVRFPETVNRYMGEVQDALEGPVIPDLLRIIGQGNIALVSMADAFEQDDPRPRVPEGVLSKLTQPAGYSVGFGTGIWKFGKGRSAPVANRLVFPVAQSVDQHTGVVHIELAWWSTASKAWVHKTFPRVTLAHKSTIVGLAAVDVPVNTSNATLLVGWIDAFLNSNPDLPTDSLQTRQGWGRHEGEPYFVLGRTALGAVPPGLKVEPPDGLSGILASVRRAGTLEDQLCMMETVSKYPYALMTVLGALSAPLLVPINCPSYIVDLGDTTSSGKTTSVMAAGSMFGYTSDKGESLLQTWGTTVVNAEVLVSHLGNLPILFNELQLLRKVDVGQAVVHMITEGQGGGRGKMDGGRVTSGFWRTVLISCGESTLTERLPGMGVSARCVSIAHRPFGADTSVNKDSANYVRAKCEQAFGWLGYIFIRYLISIKNEWKLLEEEYESRKRDFEERASGGITYRVAQYVAAMDLTRTLMMEALEAYAVEHGAEPVGPNEPSEYESCFMTDADWLTFINGYMTMTKANPSESRFNRMLSYALTVPSRFIGVGGNSPPVIDGIMTADFREVHLAEKFVADFVAKHIGEAQVSSTVRDWIRRGWLHRQGGYLPYMRKRGPHKVVGWTVSKEALARFVGEAESEQEPL